MSGMDELLARHRKEQRDLQSQITQKKKAASKKTRKSVNDECAKLEIDLKSRHSAETAALQPGDSVAETGGAGDTSRDTDQQALLDAIVEATLDDKAETSDVKSVPDEGSQAHIPRKQNRQKARLARRTAEQEAAAAQAAEEAQSLPDLKKRERDRMLEECSKRSLAEHEVAANGHCMYLAIADQMKLLSKPLDPTGRHDQLPDYKIVRACTAEYIQSHPDDFAAFLEEPLEGYVRKIRDTGEWGGQLELLALAKTYGVAINVLQGDGRVERIAIDNGDHLDDIWLAYYRHGFGLGEHYNSLRRITPA